MKYYLLNKSQFINHPIEKVFLFFSKPENLEMITPKYLNFIIKTPSPVIMKVGSIIDYNIQLRGIPLSWSTLISKYEPPNIFVDEQIKGPYAYWHHTHIFKEKNGGTVIEDKIKYRVPFRIIGRVLNYLFIQNDLKK